MKKEHLFIIIIAGVIIIVGTYLFLRNKKSAQQVNIQQENQTEDGMESEDGKIYQSKEQGFEFKYPRDWKVKTVGSKVFVSSSKPREDMPEGGGSFIIEITDQSLKEFIDEYNSEVPSRITQQEETKFGGLLATKMTGKTAIGIDSDFIYVVNKGKNYLITYHSFDPYHLDILTSLRFID